MRPLCSLDAPGTMDRKDAHALNELVCPSCYARHLQRVGTDHNYHDKAADSGLAATDFASFEVRLTGRKATDALTATGLSGGIALKTLDFLAPDAADHDLGACERDLEVKGMSMHSFR